MIQFQNDSFNKLEVLMSQLNNAYREEETLPYQYLINSNYPRHIDQNQESQCLEDFNQDSISPHQLELDQSQTFDKLARFSFDEIELDSERKPDLQTCDSVPIFESMLTRISLTDLNPFPKSALVPDPISFEPKSTTLPNHILLLDLDIEQNDSEMIF